MKYIALSLSVLVFFSTGALAASYTDKQAASAFRKADRNKNGKLNPTEFKNYVKTMAALGSRDAKKALAFGSTGIRVGFRRADSNRDGWVTETELRRFK